MMALTTILGAFGAHALKTILDDYSLNVFELAIRYSFYNTIALFALAFISTLLINQKKIKISFYLIFIGTLVFTCSLYALALLGKPILGAITPIGGALIIIGWIITFYVIYKDLKVDCD
ncbi:MAG: DUF423 domain-containing protein [Campylobacteraceae bacterium]|nr:DUF423 domain-containing protein [Campylobacteraceae bacterium]